MEKLLKMCLIGVMAFSLVGCQESTKKKKNTNTNTQDKGFISSNNDMNNITNIDPSMIDPVDPGLISQISEFPKFNGKDLDGNSVDDSIISNHAVTVMNFWYNDCPACITEIPVFNKLNNELKEKGGVVVGVNSDAIRGKVKETKDIVEKVKCSYQQIYFDLKSEAGKISNDITTFPTTIVLDRNGKMIGTPISGSVEYENVLKQVKDRIEEALKNDKK